MRWRPVIGPAESAGAGEEEAEAVRSAAGGEGSRWGAPGRWQWCPGVTVPAGSPPCSGSDGPASGRWTRGPAVVAEGEGAESTIVGRRHWQQGVAAVVVVPGHAGAAGEGGPY